MLYRVEILGRIPNGLTHNEVFATVNSLMRERNEVQSLTVRRLTGNMVSIIAVFEAEGVIKAAGEASYAGRAVTGFSFDVMTRKAHED